MSKQCSCLPDCCAEVADLIPDRFFRALGDRNRIALLARLACCGSACTVSEIACCCPIDLSVVSRHLAILRDAGLVEAERTGKTVHYRLRREHVAATLRGIADAIDAECAAAEPGSKNGARS
jgi:ArsR family transcriptional regulator